MSRSPLTAFRGERLPGLGHNQGPPLQPGHGFRVHAWKKARAKLMPKLPLEVLKRRVARAQELGLAYPQYASILLGSGRDVLAFLFTCEAVGLRLERASRIPDPVARRLAMLRSVRRLLMIPAEAGDPAVPPALIDRISLGPGPAAIPAEARAVIQEILAPERLPGDAVVLIGTQPVERGWAESARLAKFLPAETYFADRA